jgi:hypothetical protein
MSGRYIFMKTGTILGVVGATAIAAVGTNVVLKTIQATGGSLAGLGFLLAGEVIRPARFALTPMRVSKN